MEEVELSYTNCGEQVRVQLNLEVASSGGLAVGRTRVSRSYRRQQPYIYFKEVTIISFRYEHCGAS